MRLLDFFVEPEWRAPSKLPLAEQRELSLALAAFGFALEIVAKDLMGPSLAICDLLIRSGELSKEPGLAKSDGLTGEQRRLLINETMLAVVTCEKVPSDGLPAFRFMKASQVNRFAKDLILAAFVGGTHEWREVVQYSSVVDEAYAQLMVRWTSILGFDDRFAQSVMAAMNDVGFILLWNKLAGSLIRDSVAAITKAGCQDDLVIRKGKTIAKTVGWRGRTAIERVVRMLAEAPRWAKGPIHSPQSGNAGLIEGNIVPGMVMKGKECVIPVNFPKIWYRLDGAGRDLRISNFELQGWLLMAQQWGWSPPPFAVGQFVSSANSKSLADFLEVRSIEEKTLTERSKSLIAFFRGGAFRVTLDTCSQDVEDSKTVASGSSRAL